jgi:hypothetical protein
MNSQRIRTILTNRSLVTAASLLAALLLSATGHAQVPVDENGKPIGSYGGPVDDSYPAAVEDFDDIEQLDATELEALVAPVALYPDDLLAIVLPASTYPLEIVQAARFLESLEDNPGLEPDDDWDESVVALLNYPDVVRMMNDDIDWTWRLGEAVLAQQTDLIAAVESFRDRAYAAGNLKTDDYQEVNYDDGVIEIVPVDEEIIYVPYYEPAEVVVRQPRRVYYYYPDPYPVYYYPYPVGYRFRSGFFWGVTTAYTIGWNSHYLHVHHPSYWGHPYYGRYYYGHYYRRPSITVYNNWYVNNRHRNARYRYRDGDYWRPRRHAGSRQRTQVVNNYHYRDRSTTRQRDVTVDRRTRVRRDDGGRMTLNLRDRDTRASRNQSNRNTAVTDRSSSRRTTVANDRNRRSTSTQAVANPSRASSERRSSNNRRRTVDTAARTPVGDRTASQRRSTPSRTSTTRSTPTRDTVRQPAASRPATSATRQSSGRTREARAVTPSRSSRATQAQASAPTRSAAPRAASTNRQPAASRSNARSGSRGESRSGDNRRSNSRRSRPND